MFEFPFQKFQAEVHRLAGEQQKRKVGQKGARRYIYKIVLCFSGSPLGRMMKLKNVKEYFFSPLSPPFF